MFEFVVQDLIVLLKPNQLAVKLSPVVLVLLYLSKHGTDALQPQSDIFFLVSPEITNVWEVKARHVELDFVAHLLQLVILLIIMSVVRCEVGPEQTIILLILNGCQRLLVLGLHQRGRGQKVVVV